ncbi:hypothetical protein U14_03867 [Candidatus Moduliflexus flocculans]|uniref:Uncharacterized protein n=1 Tax=Candidatus Moduliflexus flocculans TaxID=1499966 RepID=A0A081BQE9_9BACT|nr:hypothetical protein U14_03867 [Candidatus Moduliflexus flocculans]
MTPQETQAVDRQKRLEEKLKVHIQREYDLGEKVITLLKQKKQLEERLQEQQKAKEQLEQQLADISSVKEDVEQQFLETKTTLQAQQRTLKTRSRMILQEEEQSREKLGELHRQIAELQGELLFLDAQKGEEQQELAKRIVQLQKKEQVQQQKLRKIVEQRDEVEKRLHLIIKKYNRLAGAYKKEKHAHEQQLEALNQEQINRDARIELLRDEQKLNEETLLKEIEALREEKSELEAKLQRHEQENPTPGWSHDENLLQVIERQNRYIQELKDKAHQRSTMLRTENETLRAEMEDLASTQEKVKWENQMLENSLKDLQSDLAEYMSLKHKFDAVQREKEKFEKTFQRRLQLFDEQPTENLQQVVMFRSDEKTEAIHEEMPPTASFFSRIWQRIFHGRKSLFGWLNMANPRLLNVVLIVVAVLLIFSILQLIPWQYMRIGKREAVRTTLDSQKIANTPGVSEMTGSEKQTPSAASAPSKAITQIEPVVTPSPARTRTPELTASPTAKPTEPPAKTPGKKNGINRVEMLVSAKYAPRITVFLSQQNAQQAFSPSFEFQTIQNNRIVRRHREQKQRI